MSGVSYRALLITKAIACFVAGVAVLAAPTELYRLFGGSIGATGVFAAREYGAALMGTFLLTWLGRNVRGADARRIIAIDLLVYDAVGIVVTVVAIRSGALGPPGWIVAGVYALFAVWAGVVLAGGGEGE